METQGDGSAHPGVEDNTVCFPLHCPFGLGGDVAQGLEYGAGNRDHRMVIDAFPWRRWVPYDGIRGKTSLNVTNVIQNSL